MHFGNAFIHFGSEGGIYQIKGPRMRHEIPTPSFMNGPIHEWASHYAVGFSFLLHGSYCWQ
jgi:hypothetical protein